MKNLTATLVVALACTALQAQKPRTGAHSTPFGRSGQAIAPQTSAERAVVLRGGKLLTITHGVIDDGVLVMSGGRITAVCIIPVVFGPHKAMPLGLGSRIAAIRVILIPLVLSK